MPFDLPLSVRLARARWKVKIYDRERLEPPHVTIICGPRKWRIDLRSGAFMDRFPAAREVDGAVVETIRENWILLRDEWDRIHPDNPVEGMADEDA